MTHSFIKEKAKKIRPKLKQNLQKVTILFHFVQKFIQIAPKKTRGKAKIETLKLIHIIQMMDDVIKVQTFAHKIIARADFKAKIHAHTNAKTKIETTFELCNMTVIKIQLKNDLIVEEVILFKICLNFQLENDATACSK